MPQLGDDIGAVWIATIPRTGSMWTTNIVREIVRVEGFDPLPEKRITGDGERVEYGMRHLNEAHAGVAVLKVHSSVPAVERSVGIVTQRDVRDAFVSQMRFMRRSFDEALPFVINALKTTPEKLYPGQNRLLVNYSTIAEQPVVAVRDVAKFLGAERAIAAADEIAAKFSKAAVKARIDAADAEIKALAAAGEKIERDRLVILSPTNWRVLDRETNL